MRNHLSKTQLVPINWDAWGLARCNTITQEALRYDDLATRLWYLETHIQALSNLDPLQYGRAVRKLQTTYQEWSQSK